MNTIQFTKKTVGDIHIDQCQLTNFCFLVIEAPAHCRKFNLKSLGVTFNEILQAGLASYPLAIRPGDAKVSWSQNGLITIEGLSGDRAPIFVLLR